MNRRRFLALAGGAAAAAVAGDAWLVEPRNVQFTRHQVGHALRRGGGGNAPHPRD